MKRAKAKRRSNNNNNKWKYDEDLKRIDKKVKKKRMNRREK